MPMNLTEKSYRWGSYRRGDLKGDILYGVVSFDGVEALMAPGFTLARDAWAERHRDALPPERVTAYLNQLREKIQAAATDEAYFEEIGGMARALRRQVIGSDVDRLFLRDAENPHTELEKPDIDQSDRLDSLLDGGGSAFFLLSDARFFRLMRDDLCRARQRGLALHVAVSETEGGIFPTERLLRELLPEKDIAFVACDGPLDGIALPGPVRVLYYGERGLTDCRNLAVPAFVRCLPESLTGRALAGQFIRRGRCDLYIPPRFDILPLVPMRRRTLASFRQLARLSRAHGDEIYSLPCEELYRRWPEAFFSVYDEEHGDLPAGAAWPEGEATGDWYRDYCVRRDAVLAGLLESVPGVKRLGGWFALDTFEEAPVPWTAQGEAKGILVHGVRVNAPVRARVILSEEEPISPRVLAAEAPHEGVGLMLNYLFFMTSRLADLYNRIRADRPREWLRERVGHLDYMLYRQNGRRVESFPLFRKACMAMREDGTFAFFHFRLGGGSCAMGGQNLRWEAADVDPAQPGEIAVYTPYLSCPDSGAPKYTYAKAVGAGRVNLIFAQDRLVCARDGDVLLPCAGVALSLEREKGLQFLTACGFKPEADGYFAWDTKPETQIVLDPPQGFSPEEWQHIEWAYGGGLTLIHEGQSCFADAETAAAHLAREGWASPLSAQTQESDIASMVRHPRTAVGLTRQGSLFALVYSGRSSVTAGANYQEMCRIAQKLVPDVWELMNVDGGGSSLLAVTVGDRLIEYNWPSTTPGTLAGMARPINSIFRIDFT